MNKKLTVNKNLTVFLILFCMIFPSCESRIDKISGYWEATFSDSIKNSRQYLMIAGTSNGFSITIDEPCEDWYEIPGEKILFSGDSLHFEKFWGLEKYAGKFLPGDSVFQGTKKIPGQKSFPFTMRRVSKEKLAYKIPRTDEKGNKIKKYRYVQPGSDNIFQTARLTNVSIDSTLIYKLVGKILNSEIPNIHSLLILKDNKLVLEEYFHGYSINRTHQIQSVTKSFTSALAGIAIDKGFIPNINEPVWKYFADRDSTKWVEKKYDIQILHLLSMSAGLDWKGLTLNESNNDIDMYKSGDYFNYLLNKDLRYKPGTNFCYNNGLSLMMGYIIAKSTGMRVDSFAKESLFNPMEITDYSWAISDRGDNQTDGGLKMRPRDMLKFGLLYLNQGKWNDKQLVSSEWVKTSTEKKINGGSVDYGYNWWIKNYSINSRLYKSFYALGHGEQTIIVVPDEKLVVVVTAGNYLQIEHGPFEIMTQFILPSISATLPAKTDYTVKELSEYVGEYRVSPDETIKIQVINGFLVAGDPTAVSYRLIPISEHYFEMVGKQRKGQVLFLTDSLGKITKAEVYADGQRVEVIPKIK